ncbi:MAG TPA: SMC-Scp complex subunit ScpB [Roseiflexaceae bacterium]|nr:SMC-Scp complex subunit ScpB [Roseiflexaceae bacterium]HMP41441.1 SMC-Scp complex subunit ScpB [Roseiflexaceae bacterium]
MSQQQPLLDTAPATRMLATLIESLLFVAAEPVAVSELARALDTTIPDVETALTQYAATSAGRGIRLQRDGDYVTLVSAPGAARAIERLLGLQPPTRLSNAALEVLAIIAYRQPITRAQIDALRGVDSGGVIRALLARELIDEIGRLETAGRPFQYGTTSEFLRHFGLGSLSDLPQIELFGDGHVIHTTDGLSTPPVDNA